MKKFMYRLRGRFIWEPSFYCNEGHPHATKKAAEYCNGSRTMDQIQLGDRVKCNITGYTGIVGMISTWLNGCIRIGVQPEKLREGKPVEMQHFDLGAVTVVEKAVHKPVILHPMPAPTGGQKRTTGGPAREGAGFKR